MEQVKYIGIDTFNRPVFKSLDKQRHFYGACSPLFSHGATEDEVLSKISVNDLSYFGSKFGCEPYGVPVDNLTIVREVTA